MPLETPVLVGYRVKDHLQDTALLLWARLYAITIPLSHYQINVHSSAFKSFLNTTAALLMTRLYEGTFLLKPCYPSTDK